MYSAAYGPVNQDVVDAEAAIPDLTQLSNGMFVVSWTERANDTTYFQVFGTDNLRVGGDVAITAPTDVGAIAALSGGKVALVRSSDISDDPNDPDSESIRATVRELVRTTLGNGANETLDGDSLVDLMQGLGGKDRLSGFGGKDVLDGGDGADTLSGGRGRDTVTGGAGTDSYVGDRASEILEKAEDETLLPPVKGNRKH